ncbi:Purine-cytosine permease fcyB [Vanrija pseudolonga]|uniref:Purine-cytosine permease fcyB n=1 Tax=Vanrija pseudolonga TaxID=143232 RepID=A0AAF0Y276_9TREE|nr:Purine-cytosine permease fcyB [Vanrija pseudolonga]
MSDIEKKAGLEAEAETGITRPDGSSTSSEQLKPGGKWDTFQRYNAKLEAALGIEARGIERVPENERPDHRLWGNLTLWLSANCVLPTFGVGILGPLLFDLGLGDSMLTIVFFVLASATLPAFCSTFGPRLGLRQMTSSRFSWGWWGAKGVACLNCVACVGWSVANTIGGAQTLSAVGDYKFSAAVGTVIIALCTLVVGLFGYKHVHRYEQYAWIPTAITYLVVLGVAAKHLVNTPMGTGRAEAASVLSFGGVIWGFEIGWVSLASDYNVYMPADASSARVFMWTYLGLAVPGVLVMWLGAAIAAAASAGALPGASATLANWNAAYATNELGGLIREVMVPPLHGGGKFFMVLLVLSVIANNIINVYSMGMSISVISKYLAYVPRLVWPIVITAIYIPLAIVGADRFAATLQDFLSVLGYWLAIFVVVVVEEHFIFRKGKFDNYNAKEAWNNRTLLPIGLAALASFCFGAAGAAVGMAQVWWIGPLGAKVGGEFGGDIGFELASGFTAVVYPIFRYLEIKYTGR